MKILALIPARGGSKGIPRKNIKPLVGKPLIGWTIDAARRASDIDRLVVSTEDEEIAAVARQLGAEVPFMRPVELAADDAPGVAPVLHAIDQLPGYDWILLLQPTSPLRSSADIEGIINLCRNRNAPSAVSVCEVSKHPFWMYERDDLDRLQPLIQDRPETLRRQDLPKAYVLNGALYIARTDWLIENQGFMGSGTLGYVMPPERSADLDTLQDWRWISYFIEHEHVK